MTHNSIAYYEAKLQEGRNLEEARHNRETEAATTRAQNITKAYNDFYLQIADFREKEQQRHNMAAERLNSAANYLTSLQIANDRARIANEQERNKETAYHNRILERNDLLATLMHNSREKERNEETERHNKSMESLETSKQDWTRTRDKWDIVFSGLNTVSSFTQKAASAFDSVTRGLDNLHKLITVE